MDGLTQGYMGYSGIPPLGVGKYELGSARSSSWSRSSPCSSSACGSPCRLRDSRFGRALRAIAGSEAAPNALGINVARYKLAAFVVAALYASVAGSLFAHFVGFISPEVFGLAMVVAELHHALSRRHRHDLGPGHRRASSSRCCRSSCAA